MTRSRFRRAFAKWSLEVAKNFVSQGRFTPSTTRARCFLMEATGHDPELADELAKSLFARLRPEWFESSGEQDAGEVFDLYQCTPSEEMTRDFGLEGQFAGQWYVKFTLRKDPVTQESLYLISMHPAERPMTCGKLPPFKKNRRT